MFLGRFFMGRALRRATGGRVNPVRMAALLRLPTLLRLGYALFRDERVPLWLRAGTVAALGVIFSPIDLPTNIPVVGQFWDITLSVAVLEWFIRLAPPHVVNEHIAELGMEKKFPFRRV